MVLSRAVGFIFGVSMFWCLLLMFFLFLWCVNARRVESRWGWTAFERSRRRWRSTSRNCSACFPSIVKVKPTAEQERKTNRAPVRDWTPLPPPEDASDPTRARDRRGRTDGSFTAVVYHTLVFFCCWVRRLRRLRRRCRPFVVFFSKLCFAARVVCEAESASLT